MNAATAQARVVVDELTRCGVRQVVVCPGSRNAPLSMALYAAAARGELTLHVRIDERSAGFLALGLGKSGHLAAVVCTSGTAVANLHPAVLEAHHARVPLLLLTADRPVELLPTGANQTVTQHGIFGPAAVALHFPIAEHRAGQNAVWRSLICRAVAQAQGGPVQVNIPLREPLVPDDDPSWPESLDGRDGPWTVWPSASGQIRQPLPTLGSRPLLVLGDGDPALVADAARTAAAGGWPVLAEPTAVPGALTGGAGLIGSGSLIMSAGELPGSLRPTGVVVVGRPTLTRWVGKLMRATPVVHTVDNSPQWTDAAFGATSAGTWLSPADLAEVAGPAWLAGWRLADELVSGATEKLLTDQPWLTGLPVARELVDALPTGSALFLGSSNPVRLVDLVARPRADLRIFANRGVAGIDGSVSSALGLALGSGGPAYALLGDLTFLHDTNGLLLGQEEPRPDLTIVVLNDSGGGIFSLLEQGAPEHEASFERVFGTPHRVDFAALCAAHGVPHEVVRSAGELRSALAVTGGLRVVEVPLPRAGLRDEHAALRAAAAEALRG